MSNFDSAFSNQSPDKDVVSDVVRTPHENAALETSEQNTANNNTININAFSLDIPISAFNDFSLKVVKEAEEYRMLRNSVETSISSLVRGFGSSLSFDSFKPLFTGISFLPDGLAGIPAFASLMDSVSKAASLQVAQLGMFAENQVSSTIRSFLSEPLVDLSSFENVSRAIVPVWPTILSQIGPDLDVFSRSIVPDLNLSSMFPPVRLMEQLQIVNSSLSTWNVIADLTNVINTSIASIPELFKQLKEELKQRILAAFKHIRFCLAPSMSKELVYDVLEEVETGNSNVAIESLLCKYYAQNRYIRLRQMVERWLDNPEFTRRRDIIWAAFKNHKRKDYISSIKVLAPEIEGISKQVLIQNTPLKSPEGKAGLAQFHSPKLTVIGAIHEVVDQIQIDSPKLDIISWVSFKSTVAFAENEFMKKIDFNAHYNDIRNGQYPHNRHGIAHGLQLAGYSAPNSLRLFMMLDAMYELFQNYILNGGIM